MTHKAIALDTVWRHVPIILPNGKRSSRLETTRRGGRCDWVDPRSAYVSLGRVRIKGQTEEER